jgi:cell division protein FtsN
MENSNEPEESRKEAAELELHGVDESPELNKIEAEKENTEIKEVPSSDIDAEKLPDIILADLLGDQISTGENKVEKQEVAKEEDQDSISIHEFLNQEEVPDTVNIETFLKEEKTEQAGEEKSSPIEEVETNQKEEGTEGIEEEKILPIEEEAAPVSEATAPTEAAEELQQESIPLSPVHDDGNIDVPSSIGKEVKQDVDTDTPAQSENKPEDFNELNIEEPKTDDINIPSTTQMFGEDVENEQIKNEQESEESVIKKIDEPKQEVENHLDVNKLLEESDFGGQKDDELLRDEDGEHEEKIEWNWGDELKEEFGLGHLEGEDAKFEMVDDKNLEKEDELVSDKKLYKDLFAQLEKTIENEKTIFEEDVKSNKWKVEKEEPADIKFPSQDDKPSEKFSLKDDEKVYLEFSNPPSKYEFVADKKPRKDKHRSVMLEEEAPSPDEKRHVYSREMNHTTSVRPEKDNYFGKIFLLIFSAFVIISASIYFLLRNNSQKQTATENSISQKTSNENAIVDSIIQAQTKTTSSDSSRIGLDEFSDFPTTATPPVPIKTGTTAQIANQNPNQSIKKLEEKPIQPKTENVNASNTNIKSQASRSGGDGLYRTLATDNRIDKTIYFDGSKYNFQTSSWRNKAKAELEAKRLKRLGLDAFITEAYLPQKGGTWYRVRIGSFNSQKEAQEFMTKNNY